MQSKSFGKNILRGIGLRWQKLTHDPYRKFNAGLLRRTYYKHLASGKLRIHQLFGKSLYYVSPTELLHGLDEIFVEEVYKQKLPPNAYILDCGANIGMSVIYLKHEHPDSHIVAFEPDERNFDLLEKNMNSFDLGDVILKKEAVWVRNEVLKFASDGSMSSKIGTDASGTTVDVSAIRLKDYLTRTVNFLKMDIEGAEYSVMLDIKDQLHFVERLFLEYHGSFAQNKELTELIEILTASGFNFYIKEATGVYPTPFTLEKNPAIEYDVQLNIFCFRT